MSRMYKLPNLVFAFITIVLWHAGCSYLKVIPEHSCFEKEFANIPYQGKVFPVDGSIRIDQNGGHIQGIQLVQENNKKVIFLSGSSKAASFMARAEINGDGRIISADTLLLDPYRHAGGFQIYGHYLAIGIEDNKLRNKSRVMVYNIEKEDAWSDLVRVIHRDGAYERTTAGAVGMTLINGHYLIVVADWDSRHLDFYICPENQFVTEKEGFQLVASLKMESASRRKWVDSTWRSYQNINLFADPEDRLYLVGFATTDDGDNVADLYKMNFKEDSFNVPDRAQGLDEHFTLTKVDSRKFETKAHTSFRWGAGMFRNYNGELTLLTSPEHIDQSSNVVLYSK